jgi:hypothetical protein
MEKNIVQINPLKSSKSNANYWKNKSVTERLEALEMLRQQYAAETDSPQRLQRVYRIIKQK